MPNLNQKGLIQFIVLIILVLGFLAGFYLIQKTQIFKPRAGGGGVSGPIVPTVGFNLGGNFTTYVGREVGVTVFVNSDFESANLFAAKLKFNKDMLNVTRIDTNSPFIKNWVENYYDNSTGEISLVGGMPNPGIQTRPGQSGGMAIITFRALREGRAEISFTNEAAIYRDSDNANIIASKKSVVITIAPGIAASPLPSPTPILSTPRPVILPSPSPRPLSNGDLNNDSKTNLVDASVYLSKCFRLNNQRSSALQACDLDGNGIIQSFDWANMIRLLIDNRVIRR